MLVAKAQASGERDPLLAGLQNLYRRRCAETGCRPCTYVCEMATILALEAQRSSTALEGTVAGGMGAAPAVGGGTARAGAASTEPAPTGGGVLGAATPPSAAVRRACKSAVNVVLCKDPRPVLDDSPSPLGDAGLTLSRLTFSARDDEATPDPAQPYKRRRVSSVPESPATSTSSYRGKETAALSPCPAPEWLQAVPVAAGREAGVTLSPTVPAYEGVGMGEEEEDGGVVLLRAAWRQSPPLGAAAYAYPSGV